LYIIMGPTKYIFDFQLFDKIYSHIYLIRQLIKDMLLFSINNTKSIKSNSSMFG
jgi:hypothetical protein